MYKREQKTYIKKTPLPIPEQKGIKIQARSSHVYNPTDPSREQVRALNYRRRHLQLTSQGFAAVPEKPYKGIGDPVFLDTRELILTALGQWDEQQENDSGLDEGQRDDNDNQNISTPVTPAKFVLRRSRKGLNTLHKEIVHGRNLIRNVRLGHGLFQTLTKEAANKMSEAELESQRQRNEMMNNWQPPKLDSSDDDDDDDDIDEDLTEDVELKNFMVSSAPDVLDEPPASPNPTLVETLPPPTPDIPKSRVSFADALTGSLPPYGQSMDKLATSSTSSIVSKKVRKLKEYLQSRPFTPVHSNIQGLLLDSLETKSLFRQLCALNWLLEAMNVESSSQMAPVSSSWIKHSDKIGGYRLKQTKVDLRKTTETQWDEWTSNKVPKVSRRFIGKKNSPRRTSHSNRTRESATSSLSGSNTNLNSGPMYMRVDSSIPEETLNEEGEEMRDKTKGSLFSFLDEYYASLHKQEEGGTDSDENKAQEVAQWEWDIFAPRKDKKKDKKDSDTADLPARKTKIDLTKSLDVKEDEDHQDYIAEKKEKIEIRSLKANYHLIRPQSSPAVLDYQSRLPSNKKHNLTARLRQEFSEVSENSALTMHDKLEKIERQRMKKCEKKFEYMALKKKHGINFHSTVRSMRSHSVMDDENKDKDKPTHSQWFLDLESMVNTLPQSVREAWYFKNILSKLKKFGKIDNMQSAYQLLTVLEKMKVWEVCNPDVMTAVDFCREKIVEMSVDDYDEWFVQNFPSTSSVIGSKVRPQTAPPVLGHNNVKNVRPNSTKSR